MESKQPLKVIIFEDEILLANDLRMQIEPFNYKVVAMFRKAEDGLTFLAGIGDTADLPDVVLMDISLAGSMTGIEAAEVIIETYHCALVFVTGMSQLGIFDDAFKTKPHAYLIKPFDVNQTIISLRLAVYQNTLEKQLLRHKSDLEALVKERTSELLDARDKIQETIRQKNIALMNVLALIREPLLQISEVLVTMNADADKAHPLNGSLVRMTANVDFMFSLLKRIPEANGIH
jgi:DNA-binding LytR/AlgR family response regulator